MVSLNQNFKRMKNFWHFFISFSGFMSKLILVALLGFPALVQSTTPVYKIDNYLVGTNYPLSLWMSPFQNLFIGGGENQISKYNGVSPAVKIAGGGSEFSPSDLEFNGAATSAFFYKVRGISGDSTERYIYLCNSEYNTVRAVDTTTGQIVTIAGVFGDYSISGENIPATSAGVYNPMSVTIDTQKNIYIAAFNYQDSMQAFIRKIDATTGIISTYLSLGSGTDTGDGGPRTSTTIALTKSIFIQNVAVTMSLEMISELKRIELI